MPHHDERATTPGHHGDPLSRRLKVLHVSASTREGVANVALGYIRDQVDRGWHVTVACPSDGDLGYEARIAGAEVRWWQATRRPGRSLSGESRALARIVADVEPDVVHLHSSTAGLVGRLVVRDRIPTVFQPHGWSFQAATGAVRAVAHRWEWIAARRWTTELVCVSEAERALGEQHGIVGPTTVLPNGVDLAAFRPQGDRERAAARAELGLHDVPTVVCVGRLTLQKGQQDLLADWPSIRARVPRAELLLVGDGPDRDFLVRQARRLRGVSLVGRRTDVARWYAAADVVAVPSRWEGMALVPLEAMASARSVVVSDVTGMVESVPDDAGAIVPVTSALADAVVERLLHPGQVEDEGWNGRSHVEFNHDVGRSARGLARVYLRLVGTRREQ
ncbi:MAG: glycosyltransferase [Nocardioides sp.]|nr:glycosyltransferase [Nocardioides sp.]